MAPVTFFDGKYKPLYAELEVALMFTRTYIQKITEGNLKTTTYLDEITAAQMQQRASLATSFCTLVIF